MKTNFVPLGEGSQPNDEDWFNILMLLLDARSNHLVSAVSCAPAVAGSGEHFHHIILLAVSHQDWGSELPALLLCRIELGERLILRSSTVAKLLCALW